MPVTVLPSSCKSVGSSCGGHFVAAGHLAQLPALREQRAVLLKLMEKNWARKLPCGSPGFGSNHSHSPCEHLGAPVRGRVQVRETGGLGHCRLLPGILPVLSPQRTLTSAFQLNGRDASLPGLGGAREGGAQLPPPLLWRMQMVLGHRLGNISAGASTRHTSSSAGLC